MNISVNTTGKASASKANKWAVVAASSFLMASLVAGCGNKGADNAATSSGGTSTTSTSSSTSSFSGSDVVATVNGENITRGDMYGMMTAAAGEQALNNLIVFNMTMQELKKNNLTVSDADIDAFLADRKEQNPSQGAQIDQIIKDGGAPLATLRHQAQLQVAMTKLITKDVKADPAALKTWFDKNEARYGTPARVKVGLLFASTKVRADTMLAQLKAKSKTFAQLLEDQKKTGDPIASSSSEQEVPAEKLEKDTSALGVAAKKLAVGGISNVTPVSKSVFVIITIIAKTPAVKPDFEKIKDKVTLEYKLEQMARDQVAKNPGGLTFDKAYKQIEDAMAQQSQQQGGPGAKPAYGQVIGVLTQGKVQELQSKMREAAQVSVADPDLKKVADQFKPAAPAPGAPSNNAPSNSAATNSATTNSPTTNSPTTENAPSNSATSNTANAAASPAKP